MDRFRKTMILLAGLALPAAAAHGTFSTPDPLYFASGAASYRLSPNAMLPDYRVRIDNAAAKPDLRMQMVDRPEIADFIIADDYGAKEGDACGSSVPIRTVKLDTETRAPDVVVALAADTPSPDYKVYVHSVRYSQADAAALLAAVWKATQKREIAAR